MKKTGAVVQIFVWSLLFLILAGGFAAAIWGLPQFIVKTFSDDGWNGYTAKLDTVKESLADVSAVKFDFDVADVHVYTTQGDGLQVVQYGRSGNARYWELQSRKEGETLILEEDATRGKNLWNAKSSKYEIFLPQAYNGDLEITHNAGNLVFEDDFTLSFVKLNLDAGSLKLTERMTADRIEVAIDKGNVKINRLDAAEYAFALDMGNLNISTLSGGGEIKTDLGNISVGLKSVDRYAAFSADMGNVKLQMLRDFGFRLDAKKDLGRVKTYFDDRLLRQNGRVTAAVGSEPYAQISVETSIGNLKITKSD